MQWTTFTPIWWLPKKPNYGFHLGKPTGNPSTVNPASTVNTTLKVRGIVNEAGAYLRLGYEIVTAVLGETGHYS